MMSERFQSGQHPDADQLNAFVEDALPAHERQETLAHLAECGQCRMVVSFALPPVEESVPVAVVERRRPWFYEWRFAFPIAAGIAAVALLVVHLHNVKEAGSAAPVAVQMAGANQPPPMAVADAVRPAEPAKELKAAPRPMLKAEARAVPPPVVVGAVDGLSDQNAGVVTNNSINNLPLNTRNFSQLGGQAGQVARGSRGGPLQQNSAQSMGGTLMVPPPTAAPQIPQSGTAQYHGAINGDVASAAADSGTAMDFKQRERSVNGVSLAAAPPAASTVDVSAESSQLEVTNASVASVLKDKAYVLPSHLGIASTIVRGGQTLALDANGGLFISVDGGEHWRAVAAPWKGRAVRVELAAFGAAPVKLPPARAALLGGMEAKAATPAAPASVHAGSSLVGTVTDASGAVIAGASVAIKDARKGAVQRVTADRTGAYVVAGMEGGAYEVEVVAPGFTKTTTAVTIPDSGQSVLNVMLPVGSVSQTVMVASADEIVVEKPEKMRKAAKKQPFVAGPLAVFQITTQTGERWTSSDGEVWKRD